MGVQLESLSQSVFKPHSPWLVNDNPLQAAKHVDIGAALLEAAFPVLNGQYCEWPRTGKYVIYPSTSAEPPAASKVRKLLSSEPPEPASSLPPPTRTASTSTTKAKGVEPPRSTLEFAHSCPAGQVLVFPLGEPLWAQRPVLKRKRPDTDVDGFNTASMSCKKRRLLRTLITSRLSSPFSLPAMHILNRETAMSADKRFLKLAAMAAARRMNAAGAAQPPPQPHPSPSTMMRRQAVINSCRIRILTEAAQRGELPTAHFAVASPAQSWSRGGEVVDARPLPTTPLSRARVQVRASPPGSPSGLRPTEPTAASLRLPPSPRLRVLRSPELRTTWPALDLDDLDDLDDDSVAFPTSEHESRYEDEPDDVYADFGVIFGGGEGDTSDDEGGEPYDDYLDSVDGIPWEARC